MSNKKITISIIIAAVLLIIGVIGWYFYAKQNTQNQLEKLKVNYPELTAQIDDVIKWEEKLKEDETRVESYTTLGLVWKSLADKACDLKIENCLDYYGEALKVYEKGVEATMRKNTLFLTNAGNMVRYLKNYAKTEDYYREAISVAPGDASLYLSLVELYEYDMKKSKEEITAVFDEGIKRLVNPAILEKNKESYLERSK
ncbi:hypothetical protein HY798_04770 [Candidatus Falkowbacteria bacterium]|nr:hypothetical protein [Candidatus Falkowbacteria bacterium]